jgi:hypothetical protein
MPQYELRKKFAWRPILTTSGKWLWWRDYVKLTKIYWGIPGEEPAIDAEFFTEGEWFLEEIKNDYGDLRFRPANFCRGGAVNATKK